MSIKRENTTVDINVDYLDAIIAKTGQTDTDFGVWIGKSHSYISSVKAKGTAPVSVAKLICTLCKADYNRLVIPKKEEVPANQKPLYSDDKTLAGIIETLMRIEKKLNALYDELN